MVAIVLFATMLVLFMLSVPIAFAIGVSAVAALLAMPNVSLEVVVQRMFYGLSSFVILCAPLFILLGEVMVAAKITERLVEFAHALVGRLRGGLGHVAIVANMIMAGISGSATADAAATGVLLIPAMVKSGYTPPFSAALVGAAATIGPIIPPSILMVVYASIANVSVGRMFLGGVIPGVLMGLFLMMATSLVARRLNLPTGDRTNLRQVGRATGRASLVLVTPLIVIAGIVGGVFTPTESAAVACIYALLLGLAIYRTVALGDLQSIFCKGVLTTGKVMFVVATASIFSWILARAGVPAQIAALPFFGENAKPWLILLALNILLLILGCLMEAMAILVIVTPMIMPIASMAHIDPIHLGVVMALNLVLGGITPPFGILMFVLCAIGGCSIQDFSREAWPFIIVLIVVLALMTYIPALVLFLPNLLMGPG